MFHRLAAHAFHGGKRVINRLFFRVAGERDSERLMSGGTTRDTEPLRFLPEDIETVGRARIERHGGGEEFNRVICLQIGRLNATCA